MGKLFICAFLLSYSFTTVAQVGYIETKSASGKYGIWWRDKVDYKPKKSKWVLDPEYDSIMLHSFVVNPYTSGVYPHFSIVYKNGAAGLFRAAGDGKHDLLLKTDYDKINYSRGFCTLLKQGKWGVYNGFTGKLILPLQYDQIELDTTDKFYTENALVKKSGKTGMYNLIYDYWVLEPSYDSIIRHDHIYLASINGKTGAYYDKFDNFLKSRNSFSVIPQGIYRNITIPDPKSNFLIVDSMGRKGVWVMNRYEKRSSILIEAAYDSIQYSYNKGPVYTVYNNGGKGEFNSTGWVIKPDKMASYKRYNIWSSPVTVHYLPGVGFDIVWTENEANKKLHIADKNKYDYFDLDGDILLAKSGKKTTGYFITFSRLGTLQQLSVQESKLLFTAADNYSLYPETGEAALYIKERTVIYENNGEYGWWSVITKDQKIASAISGPMKMNKVELYFKDKFKAFGAPLLLVNDLGRWGIISTTKGWIVPAYYDMYKPVNDSCIWFREKSKSTWNLFNAAHAQQFTNSNFDEKFHGLSWFLHNGKEATEFDTIIRVRSKDAFKINGNWFFVKNKRTVPTNIFGSGDELQKISKDNAEYMVFEKATGVGIRRNGKEIIAPYLPAIQYDGSGFLFVANGKPAKLNASSISDQFNPAAFAVHEQNISCGLCKGNGFVYKNETVTIPSSTRTREEPYQVEESSYDTRWDPSTNSYKGYRTVKTITKYKTITETTPQRTETVSQKVNCGTCSGEGKVSAAAVCKLQGTEYTISR